MSLMGFLKGTTIILYEKVQTREDAFHRAQFQETPVEVENVLISPLSQTGEEILGEISLNGKKARYQLAIPKGDTHNWEDATVEFFGEKWRTIGYSTRGMESMIPLDWNRKVVVERNG